MYAKSPRRKKNIRRFTDDVLPIELRYSIWDLASTLAREITRKSSTRLKNKEIID